MKALILKLKVTVLTLAIALTGVFAQTSNYPWSVGLNIGLSEYSGDMGNGFFKFQLSEKDNNQPGVFGVSISRYINKDFDVALNGLLGEWGYFEDMNNRFFTSTRYVGANLRWKFLGKEGSRITPYALAGLGYRGINLVGDETQNELVIPLGLGANIKLTEKFALNLQSNFGYTTGDAGDGITQHANDLLWQHSIGISYLFGKFKDADGDGVIDSKDLEPNTVKGALVNKAGQMLDMDKDGVADNLDKCPQIAGLSAFAGCPDTDGDGIQDSEDKCPTVAGIAKFNGCPDTDGDGIEDSEDKCPKVFGVALFKGCPDTDNDGVQDSEDKCPTIAGLKEFAGCPDTDGDGIPDIKDKCPTVKGVASNKGCPEMKPDVKKAIEEAVEGIMFETNSAKIRAISLPKVDNVAKIMKANATYKLEIEGYTDNVGNPQSNLQLSKERANSVKQYLINKGISADRLTADGFGEDNPRADNNTEAGRLKNRRVEFTIVY